ncbi:MAG TPA: alpha/beta fold hydrolase [Candidatus Bathyarchaeia archaeon]|nr:alpha/beta fold hydrolase [Candidatus Bathyarchaeia archaeon]
MKRWEVLLAIAGAALLALSAWAIKRTELPHRDSVVVTGDCHMPVTIVGPAAKSRPAAILFHGLAADRRIMEPLGDYLATENKLRVYLFDLAGHGDNIDAFSFVRADACARVTVESMIRSGEVDPKRTILVGHSMGGAIAIRLADRAPVAGTIAISPAPMPLPQRMPSNLLVFSAEFDLPILKSAARALAQAAGGERTKPDDFLQARAFHLEVTSLSDHTSLLVDPRVLQQASEWADDVLYSSEQKDLGINDWNEQVGWDYRSLDVWGLKGHLLLLLAAYGKVAPYAGLLAMFLLYPMCATIVTKLVGRLNSGSRPPSPPVRLVLAEGAVCALGTVLVLARLLPMRFVRLYTGDYLASLLLIAGVLLLALNWKFVRQSLSFDLRAFLAAAALGFSVMLGIGAWLNWQTADLWLNAPRWWRFAALLPAAWIFCFSEEVILGCVGEGWGRAARFGVCIAVRAELWLACLLTYYALASGRVLMLILVASFAVFSLLQRLATDALRLRTGSPTAATLFGAILCAWFIAAVFPLT